MEYENSVDYFHFDQNDDFFSEAERKIAGFQKKLASGGIGVMSPTIQEGVFNQALKVSREIVSNGFLGLDASLNPNGSVMIIVDENAELVRLTINESPLMAYQHEKNGQQQDCAATLSFVDAAEKLKHLRETRNLFEHSSARFAGSFSDPARSITDSIYSDITQASSPNPSMIRTSEVREDRLKPNCQEDLSTVTFALKCSTNLTFVLFLICGLLLAFDVIHWALWVPVLIASMGVILSNGIQLNKAEQLSSNKMDKNLNEMAR
jgi:hypothetical protein